MDSDKKPTLLDRVKQKIRFLHYSKHTERTYVHWIRRFILFHNKRHPKDMGGNEVSSFLSYLELQDAQMSRAHGCVRATLLVPFLWPRKEKELAIKRNKPEKE